jgi:hypothetical protein
MIDGMKEYKNGEREREERLNGDFRGLKDTCEK